MELDVEPSRQTLLVIGAGIGQLPAIAAAKRMGVRVAALDKNPEAPGLLKADLAAAVDVVDTTRAIEFARQVQATGVMTMQSDLPVPTVAAICEALGLPGISPQAANWCSNKIAMRRRLLAAGVPQPEFRVVRNETEASAASADLGFPVVVKSPESSGSRGVTVVVEHDQIPQAVLEALDFSPSGEVLVESFVSGYELGAQTLSLNGTCRLVLIHDDQMDAESSVVPVGHSYPASINDVVRAAIERTTRLAVETLEIKHGPANVDLIVGDDGHPYVIEIGARIGATCLPELTTVHTGIDWTEAAIRCALGDTPSIPVLRRQPAAARVITSRRSGRFQSAEVPPTHEGGGILEWGLDVRPGDLVRQFKNGPDRIGHVLAVGQDAAEALARAERFAAGVVLQLEAVGD